MVWLAVIILGMQSKPFIIQDSGECEIFCLRADVIWFKARNAKFFSCIIDLVFGSALIIVLMWRSFPLSFMFLIL